MLFYLNKLTFGKKFICKVERLNVKQYRSRWDGSLSRLIWTYTVCKSLLLLPVTVKELTLIPSLSRITVRVRVITWKCEFSTQIAIISAHLDVGFNHDKNLLIFFFCLKCQAKTNFLKGEYLESCPSLHSVDPHLIPQRAASDQGLYCLPFSFRHRSNGLW